MAEEINVTHPFQVSIWIEGNGNPQSLFARGSWLECARCRTRSSADEIVQWLAVRYGSAQVAELLNDECGARFIGCAYYPASARQSGGEKRG